MNPDTTPEAEAMQRAAHARLTPEQRLKQALDMSQFVAELAAQGERDRAAARLKRADQSAAGPDERENSTS